AEEAVERVQTRLPLLLARVEPVAERGERLVPEGVDASAGCGFDVDERCVAQHAEVLRRMRSAEVPRAGDVGDRGRTGAQQLDDPETARFPECGEGGHVHW